MIQATELRIGNYLKNDGVVVKIDARSIFDIWGGNLITRIKKYEPILITVAWLDKFGFDEGFDWESGDYTNSFDLSLVVTYNEDTKDFSLSKYLKSGFIGSRLVIKNKLKYIHQLQNLYFALTGEELTLSVT